MTHYELNVANCNMRTRMSNLSGVEIRPTTNNDAPAISAVALSAIRTTNARDYTPEAIEEICSNFTVRLVVFHCVKLLFPVICSQPTRSECFAFQ